MTNTASLNRTLFLKDNLPVLRGLDSKSVDLIATDPPFNKGVKDFEGTTKAGAKVSYKDVWNWDDDVHDEWIDQIRGEQPKLFNVIHYANEAAGDDMGAFLCFMAVRVLEMERVLKDTGSIYLHCDPTASHYLNAMMDVIFGRENFRNEIVWYYKNASRGKKQRAKAHDIVLLYAKDGEGIFNRENVLIPYESGMTAWRHKKAGKEPPKGKTPDDVIVMPSLNTMDKERTGYPTQKPLALYKNFIEASSNPGDIVLDPFAGCATTCVAAEQLGRQWIGVDIQETAGDVILERLQNEVINGSMAWNSILKVLDTAPERTDDGKYAAPELILVSPPPHRPKMSTVEVKARLLEMDGMVCLGCGWAPHHADYLQVDHRKPRDKKGREVLTNFGLLCGPCNMKKGSKWTLHELHAIRIEEGRMDMEWYERDGKWK